MPLDARVEAKKLRDMYNESPSQGKVNILLTGESGSGKTSLLRTAPWPIHIDSFDPGGTKSVRDLIKSGDIIADTEFEDEDPMHPRAFGLWMDRITERARGGYFDSIATYMLDSGTTFSDATLNWAQGRKTGSGPGKVPVWNKDYHPQKVAIRNYLRVCMTLKCHFIFTAHLEPKTDKEGNTVAWRAMFTGKGAITIPLLFDELWLMKPKETSQGFEYNIKMRSAGLWLARSRLAAKSILKDIEPGNLKTILKKAGLSHDDKPSLFGEEEK